MAGIGSWLAGIGLRSHSPHTRTAADPHAGTSAPITTTGTTSRTTTPMAAMLALKADVSSHTGLFPLNS